MAEAEESFYENQSLVPQVGFRSNFVDRKWKLSQLRKGKDAQRNEVLQQKAQEYKRILNATCSSGGDGFVGEDDQESSPVDKDNDVDFVCPAEKTRYAFKADQLNERDDELPYIYRHIRSGARSVRPEFYILIHKLKAQLHISEKQAEGAVVEVANTLFGRKWKLYEQNQVTDNNILPAPSNINRTELSAEAMVLPSVMDDMVSPDSEDTVMTYANDGSSKSKVGSFVVQSFIVNGKQRVLPVILYSRNPRKA